MAKILIVGCGYVGIELARSLTSSGHQCWGLRRNCSGLPQEVNAVPFDLSKTEALLWLPKGITCVFFMLGAQGRSDREYRSAYVDSQQRLLKTLERSGSGQIRYIYISSTGVYGQSDGSWVDETSQIISNAGRQSILVEGEQLALNSRHLSTVVRFGGIYGPGRMNHVSRLLEGGSSKNMHDSRITNRIQLEDCVGVLAHLLNQNSLPSIINAVDDCPASVSEMRTWASSYRKNTPEPMEASGSPGKYSGKRVSNRLLRKLGYNFKYPDYRAGYASLLERM